MPSRLVNKNIWTETKRTSMRLEPELWAVLRTIAKQEKTSDFEIIAQARKEYSKGGLTSAVRVYIVEYLRKRAAL